MRAGWEPYGLNQPDHAWWARVGTDNIFRQLVATGQIGSLHAASLVETSGLEPPTPCLQSRCSTS